MPRRAGHFSASSDSSPYSSQDGIFPLSPARQSLNSSGSHALDGGPINSNPHTLLDMTPLSGSISSSVSGASVEDSESADGIDDGTSSTEDRAESSARLLRGHGHLSDTEGSFTSRLSSRAPSPLLGANSNQKKPSQLHIHHHHYHHDALRRTTAPNTPAPDESQEHVPDFFAHENYRSGRLARKLGFADMGIRKGQVATGLRSVASSPALASSWFGMNPSAYNKKTRRDSNINLDAPPSYFALTPDTSGPGLLPLCWPSVQKASRRFLRLPFVPTQPLTILFTLVIIISFILSSTTFVIHALNNDKAPLPWRTYCQEQAPFPHDYADSLDPVNVFVGVFSFDAAYERRHLIRSTYMRQSSPGPNVQVKFILGRPRPNHARRIALEMETYNDLVVLDTKENMNQGKTYSFFNWAAENATVPVYWRDARNQYGVGFQKADFVVKADDDAFLVLSELERHLRVAPREMTYWGCEYSLNDSASEGTY